MSDSTQPQASLSAQDQSAEEPCDQPPSLHTHSPRIPSLLGKRSHETDEVTSLDVAELSPPSPLDLSNSSGTDEPGLIIPTHNGTGNLCTTDGAADKINKRWAKPVAAIFIHAGAGYHSAVNEETHLRACSEAARVSMRALKAGRSAIEAVEAAIKVLENKEITNAGFGSNLAIDGTVECDATVVDHFGRSGACGAVPNVKNPITLARVILESSNKPLSLRRVPPNLLVGDGARDFAREAGVELVGNDGLVSKNARDRFVRWRDDLNRAEGRENPTASSNRGASPPDLDHRKEHTSAILTGTWNEGQPDSPSGSPWQTPQNNRSPASATSLAAATPQSPPKLASERSPLSFLGGSPSHKRQRVLPVVSDDYTDDYATGGSTTRGLGGDDGTHPPSHTPPTDGASDERIETQTLHATRLANYNNKAFRTNRGKHKYQDHDRVTDTVGAIAIDQSGRIAAGSSSGGIGMKHRGRVGPAALVGVGTAVIPADDHDAEHISVAAVTSGTGEHMATTMASQRCAERLYQGTLRGFAGQDTTTDDEGAIISGFILNDFLGHPGVRESASPGAIGAMAVKKAPGGYYLYFAHNTESFALASMGSNDLSPACVMSRINEGGGSIAQGARKIRI